MVLKAPSPSLHATPGWEERYICHKVEPAYTEVWTVWKTEPRTEDSKDKCKAPHLGQNNPKAGVLLHWEELSSELKKNPKQPLPCALSTAIQQSVNSIYLWGLYSDTLRSPSGLKLWSESDTNRTIYSCSKDGNKMWRKPLEGLTECHCMNGNYLLLLPRFQSVPHL